MSFTADLFADVDRMDAAAFASYLSDDCVLRFANADEVKGRAAIEQAIAGFFQAIGGLSHRVVNEWHADGTTICQLDVTYTRLDGGQVTVPAVAIMHRPGELIDDYRIYVDQAPLWA